MLKFFKLIDRRIRSLSDFENRKNKTSGSNTVDFWNLEKILSFTLGRGPTLTDPLTVVIRPVSVFAGIYNFITCKPRWAVRQIFFLFEKGKRKSSAETSVKMS